MKLIVGLGNPGEKFVGTRHNLGFEVVDELASRIQGLETSWRIEKKFKAEILQVNYTLDASNYSLILAKPQTFMNLSGLAVSLLKNFFKVAPEDLVIIHDELDLLLGKIKIRFAGGASGHHGVESIISELGTDQFVRVRLGIGSDKSFSGEHKRVSFNAESFVTEPFLPQERSKVKSMIKHGVIALETLLEKGLKKAQNQYN